MSSSQSYLIIGAGVFGVSTAFHLIKKYPHAQVTILDRDAYDAETRVAASWDWNKVIRADYDDLVYCRLGLEAQDIFESDPLFQPYFHKTGIYWMCRSDYAKDVVDNYAKLGRKADLAAVPVAEARKLYNGIFQDADYSDVKEILVNKTSGWVAAGDCLRAVTKRAMELGVKYKVGEVQTLTFDSNGRCTGAKTTAGDHITARQVVLSTGAYTAKLLEHSAAASRNTKLRAENRICAGGITTGMVKLDDKLYQRYAKMPVGVQGYTNETGPFIGSLPPTPDRELKWWGQKIFRNTQQVLPGRFVSAPPVAREYGQWDTSKKLKEDIDHAADVFYGKDGANWKKEKLRICWDAFTADGDFIISPHAGAPGLFVATCGNFHGWKFFPVIGKYIVEMLEGRMEKELVQKWAWDRQQPDYGAFADYPRYELNNLADPRPRREAKL